MAKSQIRHIENNQRRFIENQLLKAQAFYQNLAGAGDNRENTIKNKQTNKPDLSSQKR